MKTKKVIVIGALLLIGISIYVAIVRNFDKTITIAVATGILTFAGLLVSVVDSKKEAEEKGSSDKCVGGISLFTISLKIKIIKWDI
jgi:hypothetical protein